MGNLDLQSFRRSTPQLSGAERLALFSTLPKDTRNEFFGELARERQIRRSYDHQRLVWEQDCLGVDGIAPPSLRRLSYRLAPPPAPREEARLGGERRIEIDERLLEIPAEDYVAAIIGADIGRQQPILCPLPGHDDSQRPNFHLYEHNWNCYGCNRGGRIYQFAGLVWGFPLPLRGRAFNEVFGRLCTLFRLA